MQVSGWPQHLACGKQSNKANTIRDRFRQKPSRFHPAGLMFLNSEKNEPIEHTFPTKQKPHQDP